MSLGCAIYICGVALAMLIYSFYYKDVLKVCINEYQAITAVILASSLSWLIVFIWIYDVLMGNDLRL